MTKPLGRLSNSIIDEYGGLGMLFKKTPRKGEHDMLYPPTKEYEL
jgi:hypothetical protein